MQYIHVCTNASFSCVIQASFLKDYFLFWVIERYYSWKTLKKLNHVECKFTIKYYFHTVFFVSFTKQSISLFELCPHVPHIGVH